MAAFDRPPGASWFFSPVAQPRRPCLDRLGVRAWPGRTPVALAVVRLRHGPRLLAAGAAERVVRETLRRAARPAAGRGIAGRRPGAAPALVPGRRGGREAALGAMGWSAAVHGGGRPRAGGGCCP